MRTFYKTDKNNKRWMIWHQKSSGNDQWAVLPVGDNSESIFADAAPSKEEAMSLIAHMSEADEKEIAKWRESRHL